jgi:hypothetical protein
MHNGAKIVFWRIQKGSVACLLISESSKLFCSYNKKTHFCFVYKIKISRLNEIGREIEIPFIGLVFEDAEAMGFQRNIEAVAGLYVAKP